MANLKYILFIGLLLLTSLSWAQETGSKKESQEHGSHESDSHSSKESDGHDDHESDGHDDHDENIVQLSLEQFNQLELSTVAARQGRLIDARHFPAEVQFDPLRVAHLVPRVAGIVREVRFQLGDRVKRGQIMAALESRELGQAKSDYLAALARQVLRQKTYQRERQLREKGISAEQEYLEALQALEEGRIQTRQTHEVLISLGLTKPQITLLQEEKDQYLNRYQMSMPFDGRITEQHITIGEMLKGERPAFVVVDTSQVWVIARIPERDVDSLKIGQPAVITLNSMPDHPIEASLKDISSQLDAETRTVAARFVIANSDGRLLAGMFGQVTIMVTMMPKEENTFLLPESALQRDSDSFVIFKKLEAQKYQMFSVTVLNHANGWFEVKGDLSVGEMLATGDLFILKSELSKKEMGQGHSH